MSWDNWHWRTKYLYPILLLLLIAYHAAPAYLAWLHERPPLIPLNCYGQIEADAGQLEVTVEKGMAISPCLYVVFAAGSPMDIAQDSCVAVRRRTLVLELHEAGQGDTVHYYYGGERMRDGPIRSFDPAGLSPSMLETRLVAEKDSLYCRWRQEREDRCRNAEIADSTNRALEAMGGPYRPCPRENCR